MSTNTYKIISASSYQIINSRYYDLLVQLLNICNCIFVILDSPIISPDTLLKRTIRIVDIIILSIYSLEIVIKFLALQNIGKFFFNPQNISLFISFICSLFSQIFYNNFRMLKAISIIRFLEISKYITNLKVILKSLYKSIPILSKLLILVLLFFWFISLYTLKYFKGQSYIC